ncbi:hypothetical protein DMENIID0001_106350 [Sergentomyia squamirostris]
MVQPALNVDKFIEDVKNHPVLWHRDYPKIVKQLQEAWNEISMYHGIPQRLLRTKWKTLRDSFRTEMRKIPRTADGEFAIPPPNFPSNWIHYNQMVFLAGQMRERGITSEDLTDPMEQSRNSGNYMEETTTSDNYPMDYNNSDQLDSKELLRQQLQAAAAPMRHVKKAPSRSKFSSKRKVIKGRSVPSTPPTRVSSRPKTKPKPPSPKPVITTTTMERVETPPMNPRAQESSNDVSIPKDDDYYFLMSLHPYMTRLKYGQKLQTRMEIQNIIFKKLYNQGEFEEA